jgi:hypothetical protein
MLKTMGVSGATTDGVDAGEGLGVVAGVDDGDGDGVDAGDGDGDGVDDGVDAGDGEGGGGSGGGEGAVTVSVAAIGCVGGPTLVTVGAPAAARAVLRLLVNDVKAGALDARVLMLCATACCTAGVVLATVKLTETPVERTRRRAVVMSVT